MKMLAEIKKAELLLALTHEKGSLFFRKLEDEEHKGQYHVLYFSGSRVVQFTGELTTKQFEELRALGYECSSLELDLSNGFVRIVE